MTRRRWVPLWVLPVLAFFAIGTVWLRLFMVKTAYEIDFSEREIAGSLHEKEKLQLKLAALRSPRRLEALARTRFRLSQPRTDQMIHIRKSEIEGNG